MARLAGAMMILLACGAAGQWFASRLVLQVRRLRGADQGLLALSREIRQLATPLPLALQRAAQAAGEAGPLFVAAAAGLRRGDGLAGGAAWRQAVEQDPQWPLESKEALLTAAEGLGQTDGPEQARLLELTRQRLAVLTERAEAESRQYGKIWRSMGWAAGAMLVLLLL